MTGSSAVSVTTRAIDDALLIGGEVYHRHVLRVQERGDSFGMHLRASAIGPIVIGTLEYRTPVRIEAAEFVDSYQVNLPLYGGVLMSYAGREHRATIHQAVVHGPSAPTMIDGWKVPTRILGVKIARTGLENALAGIIGRTIDRPIEFAGAVDVTTPTGRVWAALARRLAWWARPGDDDDLIGPTLIDAVIGGLLRTAAHEYSDEVTDATSSPAEESVRRAIALMHVRAPSQVSTADIADEVNIGIRTLEKRFRTEWGTTPSEMFRDIRLAYARRDLQRPGNEGLHVRDVAARWGMPHAGRFSVRYAERFGESPSMTLARARPADGA